MAALSYYFAPFLMNTYGDEILDDFNLSFSFEWESVDSQILPDVKDIGIEDKKQVNLNRDRILWMNCVM